MSNPALNSYQNLRDQNRITVASGQSNTDSNQSLPFLVNSITGRLLVDATGGSSNSFKYNEIVSGSGTSWTLANVPITGTVALYANGQRLTPGGVDYTISAAAITTVLSWSAGTVLADYQY